MPQTSQATVTWIGHATALIELDGTRILTDPLLRDRIGHLRRRAGPVDVRALGPIDVILLSHAHHDHLDVPSLKLLKGSPRVVGPPATLPPSRSAGFEGTALGAGERLELGGLVLEAVAATHDGRRWPWSGEGEAVGFVVRGSRSVLFAGDTGPSAEIAACRDIDLAMLPVAGWGPKLGDGHLGPEEAAEEAASIGPGCAVPIHWGTYSRIGMGEEGASDGPPRRFAERLAELAPEVPCRILAPGESTTVEPSAR